MRGVQEFPRVRSIAVPSILLRCTRRVLANVISESIVLRKPPKQICESDAVLRIRHDKTIDPFGNNLRSAIIAACDDGKSTRHRFDRRKRESVFAAGTRIHVGGSIKTHYIRDTDK